MNNNVMIGSIGATRRKRRKTFPYKIVKMTEKSATIEVPLDYDKFDLDKRIEIKRSFNEHFNKNWEHAGYSREFGKFYLVLIKPR